MNDSERPLETADTQAPSGAWPPPPVITDNGQSFQRNSLFASTIPLSRWFARLAFVTIALDVVQTFLILASPKHSANPSLELALIVIPAILNLVALVTIIVFLVWTYRVVANLAAFGEQKISAQPGWAVGYYFIPVLALFRPYQIMQRTWDASDPSQGLSQPVSWRQQSHGSLVLSWWLWWLLYNLTLWAYVMLLATRMEVVVHSPAVTLGNAFVAVIKNMLAIRVVSALTARQDEAYRCLAG